MRTTILLGIAVCAAAPTIADDAGHWYVTPQVGRIWTDDDRGLEDRGRLHGFAIGKHVGNRWSIEGNVNTTELDDGAGAGVDLRAVSVDVLRVFARDSAASPYVTVGMGALRSETSGAPDDTNFMAQAGAGVLLRLGRNERRTRAFSLRPALKVRWDDAGRHGYFRDYVATVDFQFSFGPARPDPAPAEPPPPVEPPAQAEPAPIPADSDGDGVVDSADRCPGTRSGVAVDEAGCARRGSITLEGVTFELDSAQLTPRSRDVLERVADDLLEHPTLRVEVQGHTDSSGAEVYNLDLSQRRAEAVRAYLLSRGVEARQVEASGYGESRPIADNDTPEGRARNRRVVISVLENPGNVDVAGEGQL